MQKELGWVSVAKGIGITLVVIGHYYPESSPAVWGEIRRVIYLFHMPLFFILSGYLFDPKRYSYGTLLRNKIDRLVVPFASVGLGFLVLKMLVGGFVDLDHPVNFGSIVALLIDPVHSFMPLLWFVHALFLMFLVYPLARICVSPMLILLVTVAINSYVGTDYPIVGKALWHFPFFVFGAMLREAGTKFGREELAYRWAAAILASSVVAFVLVLVLLKVVAGSELLYVGKVSAGIFGAIGVMMVAVVVSSTFATRNLSAALNALGNYSMTIYLFHTVFESAVRYGSVVWSEKGGAWFWVIAMVAIISGLIFPLLLEKYGIRRNALASRLLLGIRHRALDLR